MTVVSFGSPANYATVFFDRSTGVCIVASNNEAELYAALAVAKTLKADNIIVIAPEPLGSKIEGLIQHDEYAVYKQ